MRYSGSEKLEIIQLECRRRVLRRISLTVLSALSILLFLASTHRIPLSGYDEPQDSLIQSP